MPQSMRQRLLQFFCRKQILALMCLCKSPHLPQSQKEHSMASRAALSPSPFASNRLRPKALCLADKIERQVLAIREKKFADLGLVMRIQLGIADDSAYLKSQANDHLKEITRLQGLTFEWNQN